MIHSVRLVCHVRRVWYPPSSQVALPKLYADPPPLCHMGPTLHKTQASLACYAGQLEPARFSCQERSCEVVAGGITAQAASGPCLEGLVIPSGRGCTPQCNTGTDPTVNTFRCVRGDIWTGMRQGHIPGPEDSSLAWPVAKPILMASLSSAICSSGGHMPLRTKDKLFGCEEMACSAPEGIRHTGVCA